MVRWPVLALATALCFGCDDGGVPPTIVDASAPVDRPRVTCSGKDFASHRSRSPVVNSSMKRRFHRSAWFVGALSSSMHPTYN